MDQPQLEAANDGHADREAHDPTPGLTPELAPHKGRMLWAMLGALVLGVAVPVFLVSAHLTLVSDSADLLPSHDGFPAQSLSFEKRATQFVGLLAGLGILAFVFCGPGCLILAYVVMRMSRRTAKSLGADMAGVLRMGMLCGAFMSLLNLPGWMVMLVLHDGSTSAGNWLPLFQTLALFFVTGGTCGLWLAWQAWRERHPEAGAFPRFSLRTLIALAFAWGLLIMLFVPQQALD